MDLLTKYLLMILITSGIASLIKSDGGRYREAVGPILTAKWSRDMKSRDMTSRNMKF